MSDLKFRCQTCGQPILVDAKEAGRKLTCPSCKNQITIPKSPPATRDAPAASPARPSEAGRADAPASPSPLKLKTQTKVTQPHVPPKRAPSSTQPVPAGTPPSSPAHRATTSPRRVELTASVPTAQPPQPAKPEAAPEPAAGAAPPLPSATASSTAEAGPQPVQVAVLTSELKLSIVRAARELIADSERWMPGVGEDGKLAYAAKQEKGRWKRLPPGSEGATRHSLMGAVVLELHRRNVAPTATGRTDFLDQEIPAAIRATLEGKAQAAGEEKPIEPTDPRLMSISHTQCLQVLQDLEKLYAAQSAAEAAAPASGELRGPTLDELMVRAARDEVLSINELLRAVHREWVSLSRRVSELEPASAGSDAAKPPRANPGLGGSS